MDEKEYWKNKHHKCLTQDWIDKPSVFAQYAIDYLPEKGKLLDLGAGQGQDSRFFTKRGFKVWCTDFLPEALEIAKDKAGKEQLEMNFLNVDLKQTLPFKDDFFDVVFSNLGLHYFNRKITSRLFQEIARVLKKGGIFACLMNSIEDPEVPRSEMIEPGLYKTPSGLIKRFFDQKFLGEMTDGLFDPIVFDSEGSAHKDKEDNLVRFIGKKE